MAVNGVTGGTTVQQQSATTFQAKDALKNGTYTLTADQAKPITEAIDPKKQATAQDRLERHGEPIDLNKLKYDSKYTQPAIEKAQKQIADWIKAHPTASKEALDAKIKEIVKDNLSKMQMSKMGDDHFLQQIVSKITEAMKAPKDTWEP